MRRPNKYGARRTQVYGHVFDSAAEASRYAELLRLQQLREISDLELQPAFRLFCGGRPVLIRSKGYPNGRQARYVADFAYTVRGTGERVVEDVKGVETPVFRLKRALVEAEYGVIVRVVR